MNCSRAQLFSILFALNFVAADEFLPDGVSLVDILNSDSESQNSVDASDANELEAFLRTRRQELRDAVINAKSTEIECGDREDRNSVSGECQCMKYYAAWVEKLKVGAKIPTIFSF